MANTGLSTFMHAKRDEKTGEYLDEPVAFQDDAMAALRYGIERWRKKKKVLI